MELRTLRADLEAILLCEVPASLRLALLIFAILFSHATGMLYLFSAQYEREVVRSEVHQELHEMRQTLKSVADTVEYVKTGQDRLELRVRRNGR